MLYGSLVLLPIMLQTLLGYPSLAGRHRDGAARHRVALHDADRRHADRQVRSAQAAGARAWSIGGGTLLWLAQLNLQAGYWDIFWPQLLQGAGLSLLFVPLTTVVDGDDPAASGWATRPACST